MEEVEEGGDLAEESRVDRVHLCRLLTEDDKKTERRQEWTERAGLWGEEGAARQRNKKRKQTERAEEDK